MDQIKKGTFTVTESSSGGSGGASVFTRKATQDEIAAEEEKNRTLLQNYLGYVAQVNKLRGLDLDNITKHDDSEKKSSEETLATLKKQLEDLQKAREAIDVKDKKALQDNANQQIALQKRIQELEVNPKEASKQDNQFDEKKKQAQQLVKSIDDLLNILHKTLTCILLEKSYRNVPTR
jgi:tRNA U55 pseudouridine synthase TruB